MNVVSLRLPAGFLLILILVVGCTGSGGVAAKSTPTALRTAQSVQPSSSDAGQSTGTSTLTTSPQSETAASPSAPPPGQLTGADATVLDKAVNSGDAQLLLHSVAGPQRSTGAAELAASLKAMGGFKVLPTTFVKLSDLDAVVQATTGTGRRWDVYLVWSGSNWLITGTEPSS